MMATTSKPKGEKGKDRNKSSKSSKDDVICTNTPNCGRKGHTKDQCWEKGGGKEGQAPDWWKKKKGNKPSANVAENKSPEKEDPKNYAMAAFNLPNDPEALVCTSDFHSEAHVTLSIVDVNYLKFFFSIRF